MNRYNIFSQLHRGLRVLLYETALVLRQTDFADSENAQGVLRQLIEAVELFEKRAVSEGHFVLPALEQYEPSVADLFKEEHDKQQQLGRRLQELIFVFIYSSKDETKRETGKAIDKAFAEFMVYSMEHMAKEETVINKLLWRYYPDEQLERLTRPGRVGKMAGVKC